MADILEFDNSTPIFRKCLIINNRVKSGYIIQAYRSVLTFINSTICANSAAGECFSIRHGSKINFKNSVIWNNRFKWALFFIWRFGSDASMISFNYSNIDTTDPGWMSSTWDEHDQSERLFTWGSGNIISEPLFIAPLENDFTFQPNSPCIDAGDPDPNFDDYADSLNSKFAQWPAMGLVRNDMGAYGGRINYGNHQNNTREDYSGFQVTHNYPNPFNRETHIKYQLPRKCYIVLKIYNLLGQAVKTLIDEEMNAGVYSTRWIGDDNAGRQVSSGIYYYRFSTDVYMKTRKLILLR